MQTIELGKLFTRKELNRAAELADARKIADEIVKPEMERINRATGQENDALYLAYAILYAISRS